MGDSVIGPETKVGELLRRHPELEETLIRLSPEFQRLKNPVLRATVAKVATLRQVAQVGGLDPEALIKTLREAAGGEATRDAAETAATGALETAPSGCGAAAGAGMAGTGAPGGAGAVTSGPAPAWFDPARVVRTMDVRPALARGEHPLGDVVKAAEALAGEELLELTTPFEPAPLIDVVCKRGFRAWVRRDQDGSVHTIFQRNSPGVG